MNERIKEIMLKAGFPEWSNQTIGFELETFARLIVEECCDIIYENEYSTPNRCAWKIESHFGVW
jgi:hypothetical protein